MSLVYKAKSVEDSTYLYLLHAFIAPFFLCRAFIVKNNTKYTVGFSSANDISNGWEGFLPDFADNERRSYFLLRAGDSMVTYVSFCCPKTELDFLIFERTGEDSKYEKTRRRTVNFNLTFRILPKTIQLFSENLKVQFDPDNNSNCFDETNKYEDRKEKPVEIIEQGEEPAKGFELIGFIESINTYYSEGVLLFLSLFQFFSANGDRGNATLLLLISFAVMLVNATRKDPLVAFREISLVSNKDGKRLCLFEWDGAEDAALYVAPLVFNSISVVILNQALATDTIAILNLVTAGIAFGYLFFAGGVIGCALYKMMMERLIAKMEIFPGIKGMLLCSSVSSLTIFTVWILVAYFAFNPFPGLSYAAGTILLLIIVPVLGLKGILLPYAFENLGLLGGVVWLLTTSCAKIRQFSLYALWNVLVECNEWMRTHRLEFFFIFLFFAGIASIISLAYSFSSVRYTFSDDQAP